MSGMAIETAGLGKAARQTGGWIAVFVCTVYGVFALSIAIGYVLGVVGIGDEGPIRSAPPLFVLHAVAGAVALTAGSIQLRLAGRLLASRRHTHRRMGWIYLWGAWITSLSSLGVAAFFDVSVVARIVFAAESLLWFGTTTVAFVRIRRGRVLAHREWMIRSFSLAFFFVTGSLWMPLLAGTALPEAVGYPLAVFLGWSLNLVAAELWVRSARSQRFSMSRVTGPRTPPVP